MLIDIFMISLVNIYGIIVLIINYYTLPFVLIYAHLSEIKESKRDPKFTFTFTYDDWFQRINNEFVWWTELFD